MAVLVSLSAASCFVSLRYVLVAAWAVVLALVAQFTMADEFDTLNFTLSDSLRHDANVFRLPSNAGPRPGFTTKSDLINVMSAGLKIAKPYAQQRFEFDLTKSLTRYDAFTFLNSAMLNYRGAWVWHLSPRLSGTLSTTRTQAEVPFFDVAGFSKNTRTSDSRSLNLDGWVFGGWHLLAGYTQSESQTELQLVGQPSFRSHQYEAGLRYETTAGNSITFKQRYTPTETTGQALNAVNLIDTKYRDDDSELSARWTPNGHSSFSGTLSRKERTNANFTQRDFSGLSGNLNYTWTPTSKLNFRLTAGRNIAAYTATGNTIVNSSVKIDNILSFHPVWQVNARTSMNLQIARTVSDFPGPVFGITGPLRRDEFRTASVGINWSPVRNVSLGASLQHDRRLSNEPSAPFSDTIGSLSASMTF